MFVHQLTFDPSASRSISLMGGRESDVEEGGGAEDLTRPGNHCWQKQCSNNRGVK